MVCSGLSDVIGSWKMIGDVVAAHLADLALGQLQQILALEA